MPFSLHFTARTMALAADFLATDCSPAGPVPVMMKGIAALHARKREHASLSAANAYEFVS
jgi:hypothetical protein